MKKSTIALSLVVILGAGYVGASWYTGNVIEKDIDAKIAQITQKINSNYKDSDYKVAINYNDYQKNLFSTKFKLTVNVVDKNNKTNTLFDDNITIYHGPFPLAALSKGQFAPQMAWAEYAMTKESSPKLWEKLGDQPFITGTLGVTYQEQMTLKLTSKAINLTTEELGSDFDKINFSAGELSVSSNHDFSDVAIKTKLNSLVAEKEGNTMTINNLFGDITPDFNNKTGDYEIGFSDLSVLANPGYGEPAKLNINNLLLKANVRYILENSEAIKLEAMDLTTTLDKITLVSPQISPLTLNKFAFKIDAKLTDTLPQKTDGTLTSSVDSVEYGVQQLGSLDIAATFKNLKIKMPNNLFDDNSDQENSVTNSIYSLDKFIFKNSKGEASMVAYADYPDSLTPAYNQIRYMNKFNTSINIPFDVIAQTIAQIQNSQQATITPEQLNSANQLIKMVTQGYIRNPLIIWEKNGVAGMYYDVDYVKESDEVKINGKSISKEQFLSTMP